MRLLQPSWLLRFSASLTSSSPLALLGLALLHVAVVLSPGDDRLRRRHRLFSQLAVAAALAYLLLPPVQTFALFRQTSLVNQGRVTRIRGAEQRLTALRSVVESASSNEQLNRRLQELNGPVLGPADRVQPLPLLKAQVNAVLDQAAIQILRERESSPVVGRIALLPDLLRNALSNGALAFGFAALGRLLGAKQSPLRQLQSAMQWRHRSRSARRKRPLNSLLRLIDRMPLRFWR